MSYQIVVGVDGSASASRALQWALEEGRARSGEVTAVFAWQLPLIGMPGAFDQEELEREAKALLSGELESVGPDGVSVNLLVAQGDPSASLLEICDRTGADLLVVGSRGREGFAGLLLGSVGQECAEHSRCPVVIVKPETR